MTRFRKLVLLIGCFGLLMPTLVVSAQGQEPSPSIAISLEISSRPELADVIAARLTAPDGTPITEARIEFWITSNLFGERYAFVGASPTDSSGVARLPFVPHQDSYDVRVTFDGTELWRSAFFTLRSFKRGGKADLT